jgi:hypothetical protein
LNGYNANCRRLLALALIAALPAGCALPKLGPPNPFAGSWVTAERQQIAFRDDTVVLNPPGEQPTPLGAETCAGKFRFSYRRQSRDALLALVPRQPDLRRRLTGLLVQPDYDIAEVSCGEGGTTYVLLDDKELVAIHGDHDIAGIERWSRP